MGKKLNQTFNVMTRSKEKIYAALDKTNSDEGYSQFAQDARCSAEYSKSPWIMVGDQLPEENEVVLAAVKNDDDVSCMVLKFYKKKLWRSTQIMTEVNVMGITVVVMFATATDSNDGVIAWMPLPALPQEGGKDETD